MGMARNYSALSITDTEEHVSSKESKRSPREAPYSSLGSSMVISTFDFNLSASPYSRPVLTSLKYSEPFHLYESLSANRVARFAEVRECAGKEYGIEHQNDNCHGGGSGSSGPECANDASSEIAQSKKGGECGSLVDDQALCTSGARDPHQSPRIAPQSLDALTSVLPQYHDAAAMCGGVPPPANTGTPRPTAAPITEEVKHLLARLAHVRQRREQMLAGRCSGYLSGLEPAAGNYSARGPGVSPGRSSASSRFLPASPPAETPGWVGAGLLSAASGALNNVRDALATAAAAAAAAAGGHVLVPRLRGYRGPAPEPAGSGPRSNVRVNMDRW